MSHASSPLLLCASLFVSAPAALGGVLTVAPSGAQYTQISAAVAAAVDGDVILVKSGGYTAFTIDGKSVAVVVDALEYASVSAPVVVRNLASTQTVVLAGITIPQSISANALTLTNNAGPVRVQNVSASGGQYVFGGAWLGAEIVGCADVSFAGCWLSGGRPEYGGLGYGHDGVPAMRATSSAVTLHDCALHGGDGLWGYSNPPNTITYGLDGHPALHITGGELFARGTRFRGGQGGHGHSTSACPTTPYSYATGGGDGGPGVRATGTAVTLVAIDALGGAGGLGGINGCGDLSSSGVAGIPIAPATIVPIFAPALTMSIPAPVREGGTLAIQVTGPAGHRAILATSTGAARANLFESVLLLRPPMRRVPVGTIPPSGVLDLSFPVPALPIGIDASTLHFQISSVDPITAQAHVATAAYVLMLDSAF